MEEDFSTDGDGDLVLLEELDDSSLDRTNYSLNHVFITEEEKELAQKLDESLDKERVERHMDMVLRKMSLPMRCVFELYTDQGFTPNEIAGMRDTTLEEIENLLSSARRLLKESFVKRFLIDSN
jgi:DNA-directed RNA polymerase specialized sigma24 family protein